MEKDRTRRYESVAALISDVERYLDSEPVLARPPTLGYRLRKLARQRGRELIAAVFIVLALAAGVAIGLVASRG